MLLFLFLAYALSGHGHPLAGPGLYPRAPTESCDDINNCRKLFDIVWGCLATIFAATWVSVHPNVPPPNQTRLALFWRRLLMMLVATIAPEVMVGFAARQFFTARWYAKKYKQYGLTKTHGFFISMGGFVSRKDYHPVTTVEQLTDTPQFLTDISAIDVEDIKDKSKGDALSKGVALFQGLWFATQCLARVRQNLPVTEIEVATLAFDVVNVFIWVLWWNKPLDVQRPILVGPQEISEPAIRERADNNHGAIPLVPPTDNTPTGDIMPWKGSFWHGIWSALGGYYEQYNPTSYTSIPSFWSSNSDDQNKYLYYLLIECLVGTIFGAIHCAAWNADFSSTVEMWMWRFSSVFVTAVPGIYGMLSLVSAKGLIKEESAFETIIVLIALGAVMAYPIARLFLIILPLIALRALPPGALEDVNWSVYIPHI